MILYPTFGFKGFILPVVDNSDKVYLYVENNSCCRVLLNFVTTNINRFICLEDGETKMIYIGGFSTFVSSKIKVFYMGQELFDFSTIDFPKDVLLMYSDYVFKNNNLLTDVTFLISYLDDIKIESFSKKPQQLYLKVVDKKSNRIIHENMFVSNEPYVFRPEVSSKFEITILNSEGQNIYQQDI